MVDVHHTVIHTLGILTALTQVKTSLSTSVGEKIVEGAEQTLPFYLLSSICTKRYGYIARASEWVADRLEV